MAATTARAEDLEFAAELARAAGRLTLEWFQRPDLEIDRKGDGTPVTAADRAVERLIRERLADRYPDDRVIGEEEPDSGGSSGRTWIIDPIDGTKAFTRGVPLYGTLLALVDGEGPAVGVVDLPGLDEAVWAGRGLGAFHDGRPCHVSPKVSLPDAYVCTSGFSYWPRSQVERLLDLVAESDIKLRTWGDAYGYVLVATGRAEAMIDPQCSSWDVAPISVIITEAGGEFTDIAGNRSWTNGSGVATNGPIHREILELFTT